MKMNPLIPNIWEIISTSISFICLLLIIKKKIIPKFNNAYYKRINFIKNKINKSVEDQNKASLILKEYNRKINNIELKTTKIINDSKLEGMHILEKYKKLAKQESTKIYNDTKKNLELYKVQFTKELYNKMCDVACDLSKNVLKEIMMFDSNFSKKIFDQCSKKILSEKKINQ